ncbi:MAG: hypothetical protein P8R54_25965 [Myxococcota bacterium]|nr:hypothetical protein [Myxococcota bacterium]
MEHTTDAHTLRSSDVAPTLQSALWATTGSLVLSAVGPMTCYISYLIALPIGTWGAWRGWQVYQAAPPESSEHALAQVALVGGLLSMLCSAFFVFIMAVMVGMYVLVFGAAAIAAASA